MGREALIGVAFSMQPQGPEREERPQCFLSPVPSVEKQLDHSPLLLPVFYCFVPLEAGRRAPWLIPENKDEVKAISPTGQALAPGKEGGTENQLVPAPTSPSPTARAVKGALLGSSANFTTGDLAVRPVEAPAPL